MPVTGLVAPFKVSLFFSQTDGSSANGWSENYHWNGTSYAAVITALAQFVADRLALCCTDVIFLAARVSYKGQPHQDQLVTYSQIGLSSPFGTYVPTAGPTISASSDVALLLRVRDASNFHTSIWLHGVPAQAMTGNAYAPGTGFATAMTTFQGDLNTYAMVKTPGLNAYAPVAHTDSVKVSNRKVGRPFNAVRGRR